MKYGIFSFSFLFGCSQPFPSNESKWLLIKLCYYIGVCVIGSAVLGVIPHKRWKWITYIGERTMQIYFWHIPIRSLLVGSGIRQKIGINMKAEIAWILLSFFLVFVLSLDIFKFPTYFILKYVKNGSSVKKE